MMALVQVVLFLVYLLIFLRIIHRWNFFRLEGISPWLLVTAFLLKVIGGISLIAVYTYYYTDPAKADVYRYFNDSLLISDVLWKNPLAWLKIMSGIGINEPSTFHYLLHTQYFSHPTQDMVTDNTFIIRLHVLLNYLTASNIYLNTLLMNMAAFIGLTALLKSLLPFFQERPILPVLALFFIPSVVFWGSGPLKEQLLFAFIGAYVFLLSTAIERKAFYRYSLAALVLLLAFAVKPPIAVLLFLSSFFLPMANLYKVKRFLALVFVLSFVLIAAFWFGWQYKVCALLTDKHNEFVHLALAENSGSLINAELLNGSCFALLRIVPKSFLDAFAGPYLWQGGSLFQMLFSLQNTFLLFLLAYLLFHFFRFPMLRSQRLIIAFCFCFAFSNYLLIGITVPVMGAIVHYRIIAEPFLLLAVLLLTNIPSGTFIKKPR